MKRLIQIILLILLAYALYTGYSVWTYGDEKATDADAAIVLGAAQWNGKPSPVFEGRLKQGIELYKEGRVEYLILTGGKSEQAASSEAEVGKDYAMEHGVKEEDILFEDRSLITEDNLSNAKEVSHEKGIRSFLIVSDQFHLKRAVAMAKHLNMKVEGVPTQYSAYKSMETKVPFFLREWGYWMGQPVTKLIML
ncbi:YdcF family protein [Halobacillus litoralis]|uniref:YdcF family protein n=1 Tax=Halobacillus litoralis TaxID=45668 RepID=A0A845E0I0_9BACI|nr:YdcF family protein [Halobacillus litoralis]MYL49105.1 YdcF family protein [Halobacillus litoralis]